MTQIKSTRWDKVYLDFRGKRFSVWKEEATPFLMGKIPFLKDKSVKKILDAGCGDGRNLLAFAEAGFQMVGVDSSKEACKKAERVRKKAAETKIIQQDLETLSFKDEFDAIICDYVLVHLEEGQKVIQHFSNALKNKGYLLIEFLSKDDPIYINSKKMLFLIKVFFIVFIILERFKSYCLGLRFWKYRKSGIKIPPMLRIIPEARNMSMIPFMFFVKSYNFTEDANGLVKYFLFFGKTKQSSN